MNIYLIYEGESTDDSPQSNIPQKFKDDKCFLISDSLFFVKTDKALNEVMEIEGFNEEQKRTGFVVEVRSMNGWYDVSLWNWEKDRRDDL